jgi:hypothetical protein
MGRSRAPLGLGYGGAVWASFHPTTSCPFASRAVGATAARAISHQGEGLTVHAIG